LLTGACSAQEERLTRRQNLTLLRKAAAVLASDFPGVSFTPKAFPAYLGPVLHAAEQDAR
jgi:hypothetical protein